MSVTSVSIPSRITLAEPTAARRTARTLLVGGSLLALGSLAWAVGAAFADADKVKTASDTLENATAGGFQIGMAGLLAIYAVTGAAGGRAARIVLRVEAALLVLAAAWTLGIVISPGTDTGFMKLLDPTWPLSQLGMVVLAVMVIRRRKWDGLIRWLPLAGSLWLVVTGVGMGMGGDTGGQVAHALWHGIVYTGLGVLLARDGLAATRRLDALSVTE